MVDEPPKEIYWVTGGGRPKLYASKTAVKLAIRDRGRWGTYGHIKVQRLFGYEWADHTWEFITETGELGW